MGDPKKPKKTYSNPRHPWQKSRIVEERALLREYGLRNKAEVYKHNSMVKRIINHYKALNYLDTKQSEVEKEQLLKRAKRLGLLSQEKEISQVLNMTVRDALNRRLQTLVFQKKLARTPKQARQFITHRHITINGKIIDSPSYIVPINDESSISFITQSALSDDLHPERAIKKEVEIKAEVVVEKDEKELLPEDVKLPKEEPTPVEIKEEEVVPVEEVPVEEIIAEKPAKETKEEVKPTKENGK